MTIDEVYRRADVAMRLGSADYAAGLCEHALGHFPNDPKARLLLGQAYAEQGMLEPARAQLDLVLELDPENGSALTALGLVLSALGNLPAAARSFGRALELQPDDSLARESLARLSVERDVDAADVPEAPDAALVRWHLRNSELAPALMLATGLLRRRPGDHLILLARLEALWRARRDDEAAHACRQLLARYPRLLLPRLVLGCLLVGDPAREVEGRDLLRTALADDPGRSIAEKLARGRADHRRLLAADVPASLPELPNDGPPEVEAALAILPVPTADHLDDGWSPPASRLIPDALDSIAGPGEAAGPEVAVLAPSELPPVAGVPGRASEGAGADQLLVVSRRGALEARYGVDGFQRLERRLELVRRELEELGTSVVVALLDDPARMLQLGLRPVGSPEPADLKRGIDDVLATVGDARRSILVVGGDEVVPFFRVPNPADDDDDCLLTDNPYAVLADESIYTPGLPIGRLPDGPVGNVSLLVRELDNLVHARRRAAAAENGLSLRRAGQTALEWLGIGRAGCPAFACASSNWQPIAQLVFAGVAPGVILRLCPPVAGHDFDAGWLTGRRFLHFDLHGTPEGSAWYSEAPPGDDETSALPIVLTPDRLAAADLAAPIVFSAASFGARVAAKSTADSLALRFLGEGAAGFVGSTGTSYGSVEPPLAGADLLGHLFWREVREGQPIGRALQAARRAFTQLVVERQGYLDGEDQKTLLEFVLYGDPLWATGPGRAIETEAEDDAILTALLCNQTPPSRRKRQPSERLRRRALEQLVSLCPDVADGTVRACQRAPCRGDCNHPGHDGAGDGPETPGPAIIQLTARKEMTTADGGRIVKIARVSLARPGDTPKTLVTR